MRPIRYAVLAAVTLFITMTILSVALFSKCRCVGKRFSLVLCFVGDRTPETPRDLPTCRENLLMLTAVKFEWARECGAADGAEVPWEELRAYLLSGKKPRCPQGGRYHFGPVGELPSCVGRCPLHASPLAHALDPGLLYAAEHTAPPLGAVRATLGADEGEQAASGAPETDGPASPDGGVQEGESENP